MQQPADVVDVTIIFLNTHPFTLPTSTHPTPSKNYILKIYNYIGTKKYINKIYLSTRSKNVNVF